MAGERQRDGSRQIVSGEEFDVALSDTLASARQLDEQAALLIVRIDDNAAVSHWGDGAARAVRRWMAATIGSALRADDVFTHDGGDDFAVLRRRVSPQGASALGYRIQSRVTHSPCHIREAKDAYFLTVSVGIAHVRSSGALDGAGLMAAAIGAAERAQKAGGNRVREAG